MEPKNQTDTELLLEDISVERPEMLLRGLTLVGRQTTTDVGYPDLLGVDGNGRLVVFELKRGASPAMRSRRCWTTARSWKR